jgi:uncharacterized protein YjiS (DUF1127 family)
MLHCNKAFSHDIFRRFSMIDREKSASARLPVARIWLQRGEALAGAASDAVRTIDVWLGRRLSVFAAAQARRAARRELYTLDDRLLKDIGLRREQIAEFVDGMFRGDGESTRRPARVAARAEAVAEIGAGNERQLKTAA